jgi:sRNA-binding carbon storage regulator CsrA
METEMQSFDDTIGYAVKVGNEIEIRILKVSGEQTRVGIGASEELFADHQAICERIETERQSCAA